MQTNLADLVKDTPQGREADEILRKYVHCGFCNATCPTYQLLGDELDGPRGRIYLMKQMLEGAAVTEKTRLHLDRCLTCRACESTCPSGVEYGKLVDIGRELVEQRVPRPARDRRMRWLLAEAMPRSGLFKAAATLGRAVRPFLPAALKAKLPEAAPAGPWPAARHPRRMIALAGCVQPALAPDINAAAARVLDRLGISLTEAPGAGCCGALRFHLNRQEAGRADARRNINAWIAALNAGAEGLVMTASGCGVFVREYDHLLQYDAGYAVKARRVAEATLDASEVIAAERDKFTQLLGKRAPGSAGKLAFHAPCTLQHGQQIRGVAEGLLTAAGYELTPVADVHLCCGSAGTYSILQTELSMHLRNNKLAALCAGRPAAIATANIGCLTHLQGGTTLPVRHWIQWLDAAWTP